MKKVLLILVAVLGFAFAASAQSNAIGVRLGGGQGYGAELSYQKVLGGPNRLEADLGYYGYYGYASYGLSAIYQFHKDIASVPNLGWYAGVGARLNASFYYGTSSAIGVLGQAGVDYNLQSLINFPLQVSLDIRPCFYLYPATSFQWGDIALGIRYMF